MKLINTENKRGLTYYRLDAIESITDIEKIICFIEKDGYIIDRSEIHFVLDHSIFPPIIIECNNSSELLDELKKIGETGMDDIETIYYNAKKESSVHHGAIYVNSGVIAESNIEA